jgi:hypothetical protein
MSRPHSRLSALLPWVLVAAMLAVASIIGLTTDQSSVSPRDVSSEDTMPVDKDGDGISNTAETSGLRMQSGKSYVTDPDNSDTDGDGLTDGEEVGALSSHSTWGVAYAGLSDPTTTDSDRDGLDDATELDGGFDVWTKDSDGDDLDDLAEIEDAIVDDLVDQGFTDIRVNQQQVNSAGVVVGINRPDIQATAPDGTRHYWELDTASSARGPIHAFRIQSNDDASVVCLLSQASAYLTCAA